MNSYFKTKNTGISLISWCKNYEKQNSYIRFTYCFCILGVIFNLHPQVCYLTHTGTDCEKEFKV